MLFQLNINEYQGERSLQLIVQDICSSERAVRERDHQRARYEEIRAGATLTEQEEQTVIPTREDFAMVYTFLRRESRQGNTTFPERVLLSALQGESPERINYIKLKYILRVLEELQICGVTELPGDYYMFDIFFSASKTSIDKSSILKKLKNQCRRK